MKNKQLAAFYAKLYRFSCRILFCLVTFTFVAASPYPDRIVLTWADDPAHSQAVTWRTDRSVERAVAQIGVAQDNGHDTRYEERMAVTTPLHSELGGKVNYHSVNFEGLAPATTYTYRVGDGKNWTEWFHFKTAALEAVPFSFIYFGDAQNDIKENWSRLFRQAFRHAADASFTLHAGDLINRAENDEQWGEWFNAPGWVNATIPVIATPGNHEYFRDQDVRHLSRFWQPQFTFPQNGPEGVKESCYYIDYQGVRIISLNSNEKQEEQKQWLEEVLSHNPQLWTIITFHHPIYSSAVLRDNEALRDLWKPLFEKHKVDLVLTGHDHTYARTHSEGTAYMVSVSGSKFYKLDKQKWMHRSAAEIQLYQIIRVNADLLTLETYTATGRLYDKFELEKQEGERNLLRAYFTDATINNLNNCVSLKNNDHLPCTEP